MSEIRLDAATREDLDDLHQLILELAEYERLRDAVVSSTADLEVAMFGPQAHVEAVVARVGGVIAGFALYFRDYSTFTGKSGLYLEDLYVRPANRGAGLGHALLHAGAVGRAAVVAVRLRRCCADLRRLRHRGGTESGDQRRGNDLARGGNHLEHPFVKPRRATWQRDDGSVGCPCNARMRAA